MNTNVQTVQNDMRRRCRTARLMKNRKRYECGWLVFDAKGNEVFQRELEVGSYAEVEEWLNEADA